MDRETAMKKAKRIFGIGLVLIIIWLPLFLLFASSEQLTEEMAIYIREAGDFIAAERGSMATVHYIWIVTGVLALIQIFWFIAVRAKLKNLEVEVDDKKIKKLLFDLRVPPVMACIMLGVPFVFDVIF